MGLRLLLEFECQHHEVFGHWLLMIGENLNTSIRLSIQRCMTC